MVKDKNPNLYAEERGSPANSGLRFRHEQPVVRTNPVTGWKSIYSIGQNTDHIKDLAEEESQMLLEWLINIIYKNHDVTARIRYQNPNDVGKQHYPLLFSWFLFCDCFKADSLFFNVLKSSGTTEASFTALHGTMITLDLGLENGH